MSRCPFCFKAQDGRAPCLECTEKRRWHIRKAAALNYSGPVHTLVKRLKYGQMSYLAKTAAAFMFVQFAQLKWELPDVIVPVPRHVWFQGSNHAALIAKELGKKLGVIVAPVVKRRLGDPAQAKLSKIEREMAEAETYYLKQKEEVFGKTLLLVDDVMTTGTTLSHTIETVKEGAPKKLYALTLAR